MRLLTREDVLSASDLRTTTVAVPEWGGDLILGEMSGVDRDDWDAAYLARVAAEKRAAAAEKRPVAETAGADLHAARMVAWTARKPDGSDLFAVRKPDGRIDAAATEVVVLGLARRSGLVLLRLLDAANGVNGLGPKALDAAEGNSGGTPSATPDGPQPSR